MAMPTIAMSREATGGEGAAVRIALRRLWSTSVMALPSARFVV
jgi:hypothetical protein